MEMLFNLKEKRCCLNVRDKNEKMTNIVRKNNISLLDEKHLMYTPKELTNDSLKLFRKLNPKINSKKLRPLISHVFTEAFDVMNPYHNIHHLYEVLQVSTMLISLMPKTRFSTDEKTLIQIAALFHDYKHFGKANKDWDEEDFSNRKSPKDRFDSIDSLTSIVCEDAFNEIMHFKCAISLIHEYKKYLFLNLSNTYIHETIKTMIYSTNMNKHNQYYDEISKQASKINDMILIIKLADISHPLRAFHVHVYWVYRITYEMSCGKNATDRYSKCVIASDTLAFIKVFVEPLLDIFIERYHNGTYFKQNLQNTKDKWNQMLV